MQNYFKNCCFLFKLMINKYFKQGKGIEINLKWNSNCNIINKN